METTLSVLGEDYVTAIKFGTILVEAGYLSSLSNYQWYLNNVSLFQGAYEAWINGGSLMVSDALFADFNNEILSVIVNPLLVEINS